MHRASRAKSSSANLVSLKKKIFPSIVILKPNIELAYSNDNHCCDINKPNCVGITNIHHRISSQKTMKRNTNKKAKHLENVDAPEISLTPPSTPSSPLGINDNFDILTEGWNKFLKKEDGKMDDSIVVYKSKKTLPDGFEPFNIDRFLAEKILKELDIDPKYAMF